MAVVYSIRHDKTMRAYYGSTNNFASRMSGHLAQLRKGRHHCGPLQDDFCKHGGDIRDLSFKIVSIFDDRDAAIDYEMSLIREDESSYNVQTTPTGLTSAERRALLEGNIIAMRMDGATYREISSMMGCSLGKISSTLNAGARL